MAYVNSESTETGTIRTRVASPNRDNVIAGIVAGTVSALAALVLAMIVSAARDQGFFSPLYLISGLIWGVNALVGGAGVAIVGLILTLVTGAVLGWVFAAITRDQGLPSQALTSGILFGVGLWAVMNFLILPWANPTLHARIQLNPGWFFVENLVFGAVLYLTPIFRQAIRSQERIRGHVPGEEIRIRRAG